MSVNHLDLDGLEFYLVVSSDSKLAMSLVMMVNGLSFPKGTFVLVVDQLHIQSPEKRLLLEYC